MKARRVTLTLEVKTNVQLSRLRKREVYRHIDLGLELDFTLDILHVKANVVVPLEEGKGKP